MRRCWEQSWKHRAELQRENDRSENEGGTKKADKRCKGRERSEQERRKMRGEEEEKKSGSPPQLCWITVTALRLSRLFVFHSFTHLHLPAASSSSCSQFIVTIYCQDCLTYNLLLLPPRLRVSRQPLYYVLWTLSRRVNLRKSFTVCLF